MLKSPLVTVRARRGIPGLMFLFLAFALSACGGGTGSGGASAASWTGTQQLGVTSSDTSAQGVATDSKGNVYIAGYTTGGLDGNTLTGGRDFFVSKYDSGGAMQWTRQLGPSTATALATSVAVDGSGNVYVAGMTTGGLDGNSQTGNEDFFLTKYNSGGTKQYTEQLGTASANTVADGVAVDGSGNVYVAGFTSGSLDGNSLTGTDDFFLTQYDSTGAKQWTVQLGATGAKTYANAVATDPSGKIYVAGSTTGALDGNSLTGNQDLFVTQYDNTGAKQWTVQLGVAGADTVALGIATDSKDNVYVAGYTSGNLDGNTVAGTQDFFVTKYDSTGTKQWTRQLGVTGLETEANGVATDSSGNVFAAGYTYGGLDGNTLTGNYDAFVTKYDSSGAKQ